MLGLTWTPPIQILLDVGLIQAQSWRASIDDAAERNTMALTKGGHGE